MAATTMESSTRTTDGNEIALVPSQPLVVGVAAFSEAIGPAEEAPDPVSATEVEVEQACSEVEANACAVAALELAFPNGRDLGVVLRRIREGAAEIHANDVLILKREAGTDYMVKAVCPICSVTMFVEGKNWRSIAHHVFAGMSLKSARPCCDVLVSLGRSDSGVQCYAMEQPRVLVVDDRPPPKPPPQAIHPWYFSPIEVLGGSDGLAQKVATTSLNAGNDSINVLMVGVHQVRRLVWKPEEKTKIIGEIGSESTVAEIEGDEPRAGIVASNSNDNPALVPCVDCVCLESQDGELVEFFGICGILNEIVQQDNSDGPDFEMRTEIDSCHCHSVSFHGCQEFDSGDNARAVLAGQAMWPAAVKVGTTNDFNVGSGGSLVVKEMVLRKQIIFLLVMAEFLSVVLGHVDDDFISDLLQPIRTSTAESQRIHESTSLIQKAAPTNLDKTIKLYDMEIAEWLLQKRISCGIKSGGVIYTDLLDGQLRSSNPLKTYLTLQSMLHGGFLPDISTYGAMIRSLSRIGNMQASFVALSVLEKKKLAPDVYIYSSLIPGPSKSVSISEEANSYILFDPEVTTSLYRRGLIYFDMPVYFDDGFKVSRLKGYVSNKDQSYEDPMGELLNAVIVAPNATVPEFAATLHADLYRLQAAVSIVGRLGWAVELMDEGLDSSRSCASSLPTGIFRDDEERSLISVILARQCLLIAQLLLNIAGQETLVATSEVEDPHQATAEGLKVLGHLKPWQEIVRMPHTYFPGFGKFNEVFKLLMVFYLVGILICDAVLTDWQHRIAKSCIDSNLMR